MLLLSTSSVDPQHGIVIFHPPKGSVLPSFHTYLIWRNAPRFHTSSFRIQRWTASRPLVCDGDDPPFSGPRPALPCLHGRQDGATKAWPSGKESLDIDKFTRGWKMFMGLLLSRTEAGQIRTAKESASCLWRELPLILLWVLAKKRLSVGEGGWEGMGGWAGVSPCFV